MTTELNTESQTQETSPNPPPDAIGDKEAAGEDQVEESEEDPSEEADGDDSGKEESEPPPKAAKTRSKAVKKGHETRARRAKRRAELAEDPDVQLLQEQARKEGERLAKEAAAEEAKRASMSELERAKAEKEEAEAKLSEAQKALEAKERENSYNEALVASDLRVRKKSRKIFRREVADAMELDASLSTEDAIALVAEEHDYLLEKPEKPAPQQRRSGATTAPTPKRETASPAAREPEKPVDVSKMTRQEFIEYRRKKHGISLSH